MVRRDMIFGTAVAVGVLVLAPSTNAFVCDIPTAGCSNGMFNQGKCECECIEPFCPDDTGDCRLPSNSCGGNPWVLCTRGVNCPWWPNPLKAESCTTGPKVPAGTWDIFNSERACCNTNYPYSDVCGAFTKVRTDPPTKYPTISAPEDDDYEIVPIEFQLGGLPKEIKMRELKDEMKTVLQRILVRLAERIEDLKISKIEEKFVPKNRNMQATKDVSIYFNVYVIRSDEKRFGPIIISELRDNYGEVREQMVQFTDTRYIGANVQFNLCTSSQGEFSLCAKDKPTPKPVPAPTGAGAPSPSRGQRPPRTFNDGIGGANGGGGGLAGWAVALIVIIILIFGCCIAYYIWKNMRDKYDDKGMTNIYLDQSRAKNTNRGYDERSYARTARTARTNRTRKSRRPRERDYDRDDYDDYDPNAGAEIVLYNNENPEFDEFTINTYGTKRTEAEESATRVGRDPTMYIPGQEDKPDPDSSDILMITDGTTSTRQYYEDPPLKPKRDPTMYVHGEASERSDYTEELESGHKPRRDPTMYVNDEATEPGNFMNDRSNLSSDPYGMNDIDEASEYYGGYDDVGRNNHMNTSGRDPSFYLSSENMSQSEESFRTQEPSVASRSPSRSKKKKKKTRQYQ